MATQIKIRRGLASEWSSVNPILASGEIGLETDTRKFKFGNGSSNWNSLQYSVDKSQIGLSNVDNTSDNDKPISSATQLALDLKQNLLGFIPENIANKNQSNGYAGIDSSGKIPMNLLPASLMSLKGQWNASTNTPSLSNGGSGNDIGDVYECTVPGTVDFGDGQIEFSLGDWAVYGVDSKWYRSPNSNLISSVNGYTGIVNLTKSDVGLSNVDNTSDADKPISLLTQDALDTKVDFVLGKQLSENDFTNAYKGKLDGIQSGATANDTNANLRDRSTHIGNETYLTWNEASTPSIPSLGVTTYSKDVGGREMFAQIGKSGVDYSFQPFLGRNKVILWQANGNTTTSTVFGTLAPTASGTATTRNVATTNFFTWTRRLGFVSGTTGNQSAGIRSVSAQFGLGPASGCGGFHFVARFGISDASLVAGARLFVGMTSSTAVLGNADPSTFTNIIGVGLDAADTTIQIMHNDAAGAATKINLGASFPESTNTDLYELVLYCASGASIVYYQVINLSTNAIASGQITTNLPAVNTLLAWQLWRHNVNTGLAVGLDIASLYLETDN